MCLYFVISFYQMEKNEIMHYLPFHIDTIVPSPAVDHVHLRNTCILKFRKVQEIMNTSGFLQSKAS